MSIEKCLKAQRSGSISTELSTLHLREAAGLPKAPPERCSFLLSRSQPVCELFHGLGCRPCAPDRSQLPGSRCQSSVSSSVKVTAGHHCGHLEPLAVHPSIVLGSRQVACDLSPCLCCGLARLQTPCPHICNTAPCGLVSRVSACMMSCTMRKQAGIMLCNLPKGPHCVL